MDLVAVYAVFALFVFMLLLLYFCVLPFSSVNKDLYYINWPCRQFNESAPIQLAQCWFPGLAISSAEI